MKTAAELKRDVEEELGWDTSIQAASIGVSVSDAAVTLTGHVRAYAERIAAENAAKRVRGVIAVVSIPLGRRPVVSASR